jgi:hypothetical protein
VAIVALEIDAGELAPGVHETGLEIHHDADEEPALVTVRIEVVEEESGPAGAPRFALEGAFPNPCNPMTEIRFALPAPAAVSLEILDLRGRLVRTLRTGRLGAGEHGVVWNGRDASGAPAGSGLYLVRLRSAGREAVAKVALTR